MAGGALHARGGRLSRIAVVGAGLAGLAAAEALLRAGHEVVVLEALDRVGGRVWSRTLANGAVVEMGAEFILPGNPVVEDTARRLGLGLWEKGMAYGSREPRGGEPVTPDELRAATALIEPDTTVSAAALLDRLDIRAAVREAIRARVEISTAVPADEVGGDELAGVAAFSDVPSRGIAGGNQNLAHALADRLGDRVHRNTPVTHLAWGDDGVRVNGIEADAAVIAVPAPAVTGIAFAPALPAPLAAALAGIRYGHAAKLFVPLAERPPASAVLSVPERYWTWTARAGEQVQPVVHAFAGSQPALDRLGVADGPECWLASLAALRPDLRLEPAGCVLSTWPGGAYSVHPPGGSDPALAERYGPLVFAGEHTAGPYAGLMEGALRSGERAAAQLAATQPTTPAALQQDASDSMNARSAGTGSRPSGRSR